MPCSVAGIERRGLYGLFAKVRPGAGADGVCASQKGFLGDEYADPRSDNSSFD